MGMTQHNTPLNTPVCEASSARTKSINLLRAERSSATEHILSNTVNIIILLWAE